MKNEIVKFEPKQWLTKKFTHPSEIALAKSKGEIIKTGIRKLTSDSNLFVETELSEMMQRISGLTGAENLMSEIVIEELIALFQEDNNLYHLTLSDVWLAFKRGASGKYQKTYGRTNFMNLVDWLYAYEAERCDEIDQEYFKNREQSNDKRHGQGMREIVGKMDKVTKSKPIYSWDADIVNRFEKRNNQEKNEARGR